MLRRSPSPPKGIRKWGVLWRERTKLEGYRQYFIWNDPETPALFRTRADAREWIKAEYGYIATREDLKAEPHGWMMPKAVRVRVTVTPEAKP